MSPVVLSLCVRDDSRVIQPSLIGGSGGPWHKNTFFHITNKQKNATHNVEQHHNIEDRIRNLEQSNMNLEKENLELHCTRTICRA